MKQLFLFFINVFNTGRFSLNRLIAFTSDNVQRMDAKNESGAFTERIAATNEALEKVLDLTTDDEVSLGQRKGAKQEKDAFRDQLPGRIRPIAAALVAEFGDPSNEVTEALPKGRLIFSRSTDDRLIVYLNTLLHTVTAYQDRLGAQVVATVTEIRDSWVEIYSTSEVTTGLKADREAELRTARLELQQELFTNLQVLAMMYPDQPEKLGLFMQQYLLDGKSTGPTTAGNSNSETSGSTGSVSSGSGSIPGSTGSMGSTSVSGSIGSSMSSSSVSASSSSTSVSSMASSSGAA